jgi:ribosomal protein L17
MDKAVGIDSASLAALADEVAKGLAYADQRDLGGAYVVTPILYANGTHVVCRIAPNERGFEVTDNGEASLIAESMGLDGSFAKAAAYVASRGGAEFSDRTFFIDKVRREQLVGAVAFVANASAQSIERLLFQTEHEKVSKSRQVFETRIRAAFGNDALRHREVRGATGTWKFDAVVRSTSGQVQTVFEFIAPQYSAVASSYMKLNNLRALADGPRAVAVLADYERTSAELRSTLSLASDLILRAEEPEDSYRQAA